MRVHVSTFPQQKNQRSINTFFSTVRVDSGQTAQWCGEITICDVEKRTDLHHLQAIPILARSLTTTVGRPPSEPYRYGAVERRQGEGVFSS
jgi:hypothetical protein